MVKKYCVRYWDQAKKRANLQGDCPKSHTSHSEKIINADCNRRVTFYGILEDEYNHLLEECKTQDAVNKRNDQRYTGTRSTRKRHRRSSVSKRDIPTKQVCQNTQPRRHPPDEGENGTRMRDYWPKIKIHSQRKSRMWRSLVGQIGHNKVNSYKIYFTGGSQNLSIRRLQRQWRHRSITRFLLRLYLLLLLTDFTLKNRPINSLFRN